MNCKDCKHREDIQIVLQKIKFGPDKEEEK